jgi:hypothetical protein
MKKLAYIAAAMAAMLFSQMAHSAVNIAKGAQAFLADTAYKGFQLLELHLFKMGAMSHVVTRLSDVFVPAVYDSFIAINNPETSVFVKSGVVASSADLDQFATGPSLTLSIPFWNDLDPNIEPNYSNDDPQDIAAANKINTGQQTVRKSFLNQIYGAADLARELSSGDPLAQIKNRFGEYWVRQLQRRLIATGLGVMNDNVANNSGDMVSDISLQDITSVSSANLFSRNAFVDAAFTLGDQVDVITAIAIHSVVYARMVKNNDIDFIPDSQGSLSIPTYLGKAVFVDDSLPVIAGTTSGYRYVSMMFGPAAFLLGQGAPLVPSFQSRDEHRGNGGGIEDIGERKEWILHPNGWSWDETGAAIVEFSPTLADLKLAAHWHRKVFRKQARMAFLITNG